MAKHIPMHRLYQCKKRFKNAAGRRGGHAMQGGHKARPYTMRSTKRT